MMAMQRMTVALFAICSVSAWPTAHTGEATRSLSHTTRIVSNASTEGGSHLVVTTRAQPMLANVSDGYQSVRLWPHSDALTAARDAIEQPFESGPFHETPFRQFVATVAEKAGTRIVLDRETLDAIGFDVDTPVTADCAGLSIRAALRQVLEDVDLGYVVRNDQIEITSDERTASTLETVFYPVFPGVDAEEVAALVEATVSPEGWSHRGGPGSLVIAPAGMGHGLVVTHNAAAQEQIETLLRHLDDASWIAVDHDDGVTPRFVRAYPVEDDDVRAGLEERLVMLCNEGLPHGADADARIMVVGKVIVVQSRSRPFHVMAAQIIAAVAGEQWEVEVPAEETDAAASSASDT